MKNTSNTISKAQKCLFFSQPTVRDPKRFCLRSKKTKRESKEKIIIRLSTAVRNSPEMRSPPQAALTLHLFCQSYFPNVAVTVINGVWWITSQKKALWGLVSYANKWKLMAVWEPGNISKNLKLYSYLSEDRADHFICKSWSIFLHNHTAILPLRLFHLTSITLNS